MLATLLSRRSDGGQTRVYLAGPMRGLPEFNFPAFREATIALRSQGFSVWSPAERDEQEDGFDPTVDQAKPMRHYMLHDLPAVLHSDAVVVLPGWGDSRGAKLEVHVARECRIPTYAFPRLELIGQPSDHDLADAIRRFETGATRDGSDHKPDYAGFFSPAVLRRRAEYMHTHRVQPDGEMRDSDNWQRGMPLAVYMSSAFRHFMDWWSLHRDLSVTDFDGHAVDLAEAVCALMFNAEGYLHELLKTGEGVAVACRPSFAAATDTVEPHLPGSGVSLSGSFSTNKQGGRTE